MNTVSHLLLAARPDLLPVRIIAATALLAAVAAFIYVFRHLKQIERTIVADKLVPEARGPRNNVALMMCAIPIIIVSLLLFLLINS